MGTLFAMTRGSDGYGDERYYARLPFMLATGVQINIDDPAELRVTTDNDFILSIEKYDTTYALVSGPHKTESEALEMLEKMRLGLLWLSLSKRIGLRYPSENSKVQLYDHPRALTADSKLATVARTSGWTECDGDYQVDHALVVPDHKRLTRWELGNMHAIVGYRAEQCVELIGECASSAATSDKMTRSKLVLATELYASHSFELSKRARILTLVTALEVLTPRDKLDGVARGALEASKIHLVQHRSKYSRDSLEYQEIGRLISRYEAELEYEGIAQSIKKYMSRVAHVAIDDTKIDAIALAYRVRSRIVHDGIVSDQEVDTALDFLQAFVPELLKQLHETR